MSRITGIEAEEYKQRIEELLTVPKFRKNQFLQSVLEFIEENEYLTENQALAIDRMDIDRMDSE